jgi:hypothetical protein
LVWLQLRSARPDLDPDWSSDNATAFATQDTRLNIDEIIDATTPLRDLGDSIDPDRAKALALLYELPLRLGGRIELDDLFQTIIQQLVVIIPAASRCALLLEDRKSG